MWYHLSSSPIVSALPATLSIASGRRGTAGAGQAWGVWGGCGVTPPPSSCGPGPADGIVWTGATHGGICPECPPCDELRGSRDRDAAVPSAELLHPLLCWPGASGGAPQYPANAKQVINLGQLMSDKN